MPAPAPSPPALIDPFGRAVTYLRVSVTDRCDLRCAYCMPARQTFLPKADMLTFPELERLCARFIAQGVRKLRLTGGEPLVRPGFMDFVRALSRHLGGGGLQELTLTTNGARLAPHARALAEAGVKRVNVSLDTLNREVFARLTRRDRLDSVLEGIGAARAAGLKVKINTVALRDENAAEIPALIEWAHGQGMDITLIETMPLGEVEVDRSAQYLSLRAVRAGLAQRWTLEDLGDATGGPARYVRVRETGGRLGFITPLSETFCAACNRVRLTCAGRLYLCLGQDDHLDFRALLRAGGTEAEIDAAIASALRRKPKAHDFAIGAPRSPPALARPMSLTGG